MRELDLLRHVYASNAALPESVIVPPGDDMAVLRLGAGADVLIAVDQVADGVHVDTAATSLDAVGRKAITRNLSDVAAMAAEPVAAVAAACLPRDFGEDRTKRLFDAMAATARQYGCPLIGGDIAMWDHPLLLTVTVLARPGGIEPVLRRGAQVGDVICVTGELGGSLVNVDGGAHHLVFEPRLALARKLAGDPATRPHCMIDLSDGLAADLPRLCRAANLSAELWIDRLPVSSAARRGDREPCGDALADGEDYELCFTCSPRHAPPREVDGVRVTQIGVITESAGELSVNLKWPDGRIEPLAETGWEHHGP